METWIRVYWALETLAAACISISIMHSIHKSTRYSSSGTQSHPLAATSHMRLWTGSSPNERQSKLKANTPKLATYFDDFVILLDIMTNEERIDGPSKNKIPQSAPRRTDSRSILPLFISSSSTTTDTSSSSSSSSTTTTTDTSSSSSSNSKSKTTKPLLIPKTMERVVREINDSIQLTKLVEYKSWRQLWSTKSIMSSI